MLSRHLLDVSELEQKVACNQNKEDLNELEAMVNRTDIDSLDALRLVMLYALRYENDPNNKISYFKDIFKAKGLIKESQLLKVLLLYAGITKRSQDVDLFMNKNWMTLIRGNITRGLSEVTNVLTQHEPLVKYIAKDLLIKGRLSENTYPFIEGTPTKPNTVIIFVVGGITYEEALHINNLNKENNANIILGGTYIHSNKSFLDDLLAILEKKTPDD